MKLKLENLKDIFSTRLSKTNIVSQYITHYNQEERVMKFVIMGSAESKWVSRVAF